jgi:hypothetical protein
MTTARKPTAAEVQPEQPTIEERKQKSRIGRDVAESELRRFMTSMRLVISMKGMDAEDRTQLDLSKRRIINAILDGRLVIDQGGIPIYTPRDSEDKTPIRFPRPKGADFMEADLIKKNHDVTKSFAIMAASSHESIERYGAMESTDLFVCQSIVGLYMGGE